MEASELNPALRSEVGAGSGGDGDSGGGGVFEGVKESPSPTPSLTPSPPAASAVGGMVAAPSHAPVIGMGIGMSLSSSADYLSHKKRGRPRKYESAIAGGGGFALALSPGSSSPYSPLSPSDLSAAKRGRGRPPGSGRRQLLATLGEWFAYTAGGNFTPHVVTVAAGEDVAARIFSFSHKGPRSICILSANGAISNVTLRQPGASGGTLTYEGRFELLSLSGSFTITETNGVRSRTGGISVSLAGPDGRVVGGGVVGSLLAASPIQVVVGSFLPNILKEQKRRSCPESSKCPYPVVTPSTTGINVATEKPISLAIPGGDREIPTSMPMPEEKRENSMVESSNPQTVTFKPDVWQGLQSRSEHRPSPDINICLPGE